VTASPQPPGLAPSHQGRTVVPSAEEAPGSGRGRAREHQPTADLPELGSGHHDTMGSVLPSDNHVQPLYS